MKPSLRDHAQWWFVVFSYACVAFTGWFAARASSSRTGLPDGWVVLLGLGCLAVGRHGRLLLPDRAPQASRRGDR